LPPGRGIFKGNRGAVGLFHERLLFRVQLRNQTMEREVGRNPREKGTSNLYSKSKWIRKKI